eukprot:jgi/Botrbrau1/18239/Bobra.53_1s0093.1
MGLLLVICIAVTGLVFVPYVVYQLLLDFYFPAQDLKKRYNAKWALVTGASSGIGKALAKRLAEQGINVVVVALDDEFLELTMKELQSGFPVEFRKVPVNLGAPGYLEQIQKATADIDVQLIFNNAGYMLTGFFQTKPLQQQLANMECNATSAVAITHHFVEKMVAKKLAGCVVFTSSAAAAIVSPMTALYAATKAFLSSFGASLAIELRHTGIDVLVFHPSPVDTMFYSHSDVKLDILDFSGVWPFKQMTFRTWYSTA